MPNKAYYPPLRFVSNASHALTFSNIAAHFFWESHSKRSAVRR